MSSFYILDSELISAFLYVDGIASSMNGRA